MRSFKMKV